MSKTETTGAVVGDLEGLYENAGEEERGLVVGRCDGNGEPDHVGLRKAEGVVVGVSVEARLAGKGVFGEDENECEANVGRESASKIAIHICINLFILMFYEEQAVFFTNIIIPV